jgi:hypothetical protein
MRITSMGQWVVAVVVMVAVMGALVGCGERGRPEVRWPEHRKMGEKRISDLEAYAGTLRPQIERLEARVAELEKQVRKQRETAPAPAQ